MGMNYYAEYETCDKCKSVDKVHVGKSSAGWKFLFHGTEKCRDIFAWMEFLTRKNVQLMNENDRHIPVKDFLRKVFEKQHEVPHAADECFQDKNGFDFSTGDFS